VSASHRTIKWVENLAEQELLIYEGEKTSIDLTSSKEKVLGIETTSFIRDLFYHFEYLVRLFNFRVKNESLQIKISRSDNLSNFFLLRHYMKLNVHRSQAGVVQFSCEKSNPNETEKHSKASVMFSGMAEAKFGAFYDVEWFFLGSRVNVEQVARHYLTEFIQISRGVAGTA
jgi:hypothetical protein